ncbi:MAG: xanthine dehydrogenase family protein molybdopterin-binding subunit [Xanthomonadales bacterium]|nr:xanthine dehydrogenase family protein molybdopterin-binding subunit [Xanthomonadales bacterium]
MKNIRQVNRRDFLKTGGVFVLGVSLFGCGKEKVPGIAQPVAGKPWSPDVYVSFDAEGTLHIISHRSEMGQGIRTGLPAVLADEMEADWSRVVVEQATGDAKYGDQNTDGSWSVRGFMQRMREAGATVRTLLEQSAAQQWGVDVSECRAELHTVVHDPSGQVLDFKDLVAGAAELPVPEPETLRLKSPDQFRYIGKPLPIVDMHDMTHGSANYGADTRIPGMKFAAIARPPVVFGKVKSFNADKTLALAGVEQVVELPAAEAPALFKALGGIAVIASNSWAALRGRDLLSIEWEDGANADYDSATFKQALLETVRQPGTAVRQQGDTDAALASAASTLEAEYYAPHLAHASMEPPAAVASVTADFCEVWAPTQNPQSLIPMVESVTGLKPEQIRINVTLLGGAFGRKSKCDFVEEAVRLSKQLGAPVLVQWSREDDIRHDYYHTVSAQGLAAGLDENGNLTGWRHRLAYPSIMSTFDPSVNQAAPLETGMGATNLPYDISNISVETGAADSKVRIGWLRSVCNIFQSFGVNSFTDEIAHARGLDPKANLLELLGPDRSLDFTAFGVEATENYPFETGRLRNVIERVTEKAEWGRKLPAGHGLGIAAQYSFLSYIAVVVEVAVANDGTWTVPRVDLAIDCGQYVNPDRVKSQQEGAVVFGLSLARDSEITAASGRIVQGNFNDYRVLRMDMTPDTRTHLVQSSAPPAGVGEPGVPPIAPAVANAIFAATGKRFRELPLGRTLDI